MALDPNEWCLSRSGHCPAAPVKVLMQEVRKQGPHCCFLSLSLQCPDAVLGRSRCCRGWNGSENVGSEGSWHSWMVGDSETYGPQACAGKVMEDVVEEHQLCFTSCFVHRHIRNPAIPCQEWLEHP